MTETTFEKFTSKFKQDFVNLNLAWLRASFAVEPHDVAVLEDCEVGDDDNIGLDFDDGDDDCHDCDESYHEQFLWQSK